VDRYEQLHQAIFANSNPTPAQYVLSLVEPVGVAVDKFAEKGSEFMSEKVSWSRVVQMISEDMHEQAFPSVTKDSQEAERVRKISCANGSAAKSSRTCTRRDRLPRWAL
jgi:hypothetical protein